MSIHMSESYSLVVKFKLPVTWNVSRIHLFYMADVTLLNTEYTVITYVIALALKTKFWRNLHYIEDLEGLLNYKYYHQASTMIRSTFYRIL